MSSLGLEEDMIGGLKSALLAGGLLAATPAVAATPNGHYVWVPDGATVVLVPSAPVAAVDFPLAGMIARQDSMLRRVFADLDSLMATPMPDPGQVIRSVMQGVPQAMPGSGVVVTSFSTGHGTCSQTITYGNPGNGGQPTVKVSSSGDACGQIGASAPVEITQPVPAPQQVLPTPAAPRGARLWTVGYPPRPLTTGAPPHS